MISFARKWNALQIKITGQERIPVTITISIRKKQWCADVLDLFLALEQFLPVLVTQSSEICGIIHGLLYEIVTQSFHIARRILVTFAIFTRFAISSILFW